MKKLSLYVFLFFMLCIMKRGYSFKPPLRSYVDTITQGYIDCDLDREYLRKRLSHCNIEL